VLICCGDDHFLHAKCAGLRATLTLSVAWVYHCPQSHVKKAAVAHGAEMPVWPSKTLLTISQLQPAG
jgi:hypothetical protein